jgi:hypothetical protein
MNNVIKSDHYNRTTNRLYGSSSAPDIENEKRHAEACLFDLLPSPRFALLDLPGRLLISEPLGASPDCRLWRSH